MNKAVFIDRDGTIAEDVHYCRRPEDFQLFPKVPEALKMLNDNGFKVVLITNQSGIARGYFTRKTLTQIHNKMISEVRKQGARIDAIYYCPHHPDDQCECRKPRTALFNRAVRQMDIDLEKSFMIGDLPMDIEAGKALNCQTILVTTAAQQIDQATCNPNFIASNFYEAVSWITRNTL